ncbi:MULTISPECIES: ABC transporter substrate-binding protein [unclassified Rhizobium]|uniref:ABC transporter substrate-binding protein n=1 Tax=unclassified Rhizobium TaxID=2613769 RepID=UPI001ADB2458|nr:MULTISPECIES: ABC transporter substrate-binding protein [unclassified Rhizobium]MBO9102030.1 ABC transporter substrate-binding protein [Rhizobium sp. L58/93]MBO9186709.1 ABC transporter substrate-binding protein [Rhizobium sp. E27B/91]MBO9170753.1 ABC transporter substrate-binding protein [Rhizobium sp. L245/93]QXZ86132.1 ABC transporter substrate-binding protein [Rhizobium sp. K1/93]QXZ92412.1 ABC transporter substrate-binding protein [Rhizobium sp. K15/93]
MSSRLPTYFRLTFFFLVMLFSAPAWADRVVVDQIGKTVHLPEVVTRVVILQHQSLNIAVQLNAMFKVVGVLDEWQKQLGKNYLRLAPELSKMPMPGGLTKVNIEELLKLKPDAVIVTNYAPPEMISQIEGTGIPVVAISLLDVPPSEATKLSPSVADEPKAYDAGFANGVRVIADVLDKRQQGEELIAYAMKNRKLVADRLAGLDEAMRVPVYMANPDLTTYGHGKYTGLMMAKAGARNVADSVAGFKQVTMEDVLLWNPAVIFVQERYPEVVKDIKTSNSWQTIDAVKNDRIYLMPEYAKAWGYPMPEALALGELWMAKKLYPDRFADIDMKSEADAYYRKFYRTDYQSAL